MSMRQVMRQMPVQAGRVGVARGEAARVHVSDEACCPRHESGDTGSTLLEAALTRENLKQAFKRVRSLMPARYNQACNEVPVWYECA